MDRKILWGVGAVAVLALVLFLRSRAPASQPAPVPQGSVGSDFTAYDRITVNGITTWTLRQTMRNATTTLCSFPNPAGGTTTVGGSTVGTATSSLISLAVNVSTGTSTAATFDVATSSSAYATSTPAFVYGVSVGSGAQFYGYWSFGGNSTSSDVRLTSSLPVIKGYQTQVAPSEFVNVQTAGPGLGGYTYGGECIAVFRSISY